MATSSGTDGRSKTLLVDPDCGTYDSLPRSSCLTAKLRAMSQKYLQSSTNRFLAKLYSSHDAPLSSSTPSKSKKKLARAKLRSFSYGTLPGLDEFQKKHNPLFHEDDTQLLDDEDDSDSGILLNDSGSSSIMDTDASVLNSPVVETRNDNVQAKERKCEAPVLPAKAPCGMQKVLKLVRLMKQEPSEELGILIARNPGNNGYVIASVLPGGLAER